jgi:hypothetical protein
MPALPPGTLGKVLVTRIDEISDSAFGELCAERALLGAVVRPLAHEGRERLLVLPPHALLHTYLPVPS